MSFMTSANSTSVRSSTERGLPLSLASVQRYSRSAIELSVLEADARASPPAPASAHALFRESLFSGPEGGYPLRRQKDGGSYAKYLYSLAQGDAEGNHAHVQLFAHRATGGGATSAAPGAASGAALLAEHPAAASDAAAWGSEDAHDNDALGPIDEAPRRRYRRAATACAGIRDSGGCRVHRCRLSSRSGCCRCSSSLTT